jgi:hypothetical protein
MVLRLPQRTMRDLWILVHPLPQASPCLKFARRQSKKKQFEALKAREKMCYFQLRLVAEGLLQQTEPSVSQHPAIRQRLYSHISTDPFRGFSPTSRRLRRSNEGRTH